MNQPRALIVDDEIDLREAICDELRDENWLVESAGDGQLALAKLKEEQFDVIISDIRMPKVDGLNLLRSVRKTDANIVFVLMSAYADIPIWEGYAQGANAFFGKPFRIQELEDLLGRMRLPIQQRWGEAEKNRWQWPVVNHIELNVGKSFENFSLGRGGMFVDPGVHSVRNGQILSFCVKTSNFPLEGLGKVLWKRGPGEDGLAPGLGVEFLFLEESCRGIVTEAIEKSRERAFVPRGDRAPV